MGGRGRGQGGWEKWRLRGRQRDVGLLRNCCASPPGCPTVTSKVTCPSPLITLTTFLLGSVSWPVKHHPRYLARNQEVRLHASLFPILHFLPVTTFLPSLPSQFFSKAPPALQPVPSALFSPDQSNSLLTALSALSLKSILHVASMTVPLKGQAEQFFHLNLQGLPIP